MGEPTDTGIVVVQTGDLLLFDHFVEPSTMWTGSGDREVRRTVTFQRPFTATPSIHLSLTMADSDSSANTRYDLFPDEINEASFEIVFKTWQDSRWGRVRVSWMAVGNGLRDEYWVDF